MASGYVLESTDKAQQIREFMFAGDGVPLAGQIDYPDVPSSRSSYPLVFILHHAGCNTRKAYQHYANMGLNSGCAVFRWDKRGTGRSGAGGCGSTTQDAVLAYETALDQPNIDPNRVVILAQGEGTLLLGDSFGLFARLQRPHAVILAANMLDAEAVLALETRVRIISGENDWNHWQKYARDATDAHNAAYRYGASFYVAPEAGRNLMIDMGGERTFHNGAKHVIRDWLQELCPPSR